MSVINDFITKIAGLDPSKDYDVQFSEVNPANDSNPARNNNPIEEQQGYTSTVELIDIQKQLDALKAENEQLKAANRTIVLGTPAEPEKTVGQRIIELCTPSYLRGGIYNDNSSSGHAT